MMKRLLVKWILKLAIPVAFAFMLVISVLAVGQREQVREYNGLDNLAVDLQQLLEDEAKAFGVDWTLWGAYWGHRHWRFPVASRVNRLENNRRYNAELRDDPCHVEHQPEPAADCVTLVSPPDRPTDRATIDAEWQADVRAYLDGELTKYLGGAHGDTAALRAALRATMTDDEWAQVEDTENAFQEMTKMRATVEELTDLNYIVENETSETCLRCRDWVYSFPIAGDFESFVDNWGRERPEEVDFGGTGLHQGVDIVAARGASVQSVTDGTVEANRWDDLGGWIVTVAGSDGLHYYYAQLDAQSPVDVGDQVSQGTVLGAVGDTGLGPKETKGKIFTHLHFGIYMAPDGQSATDPYPYLMAWLGQGDPAMDIDPVDPPEGWTPEQGLFDWPLTGIITSPFGMRVSPIDGGYRLHAGIDIAANTGTPVKASRAGRVVVAGWTEVYGNMITVDHGDTYLTMYCHLDQISVAAGQDIQQGDVIGFSGNTGYSTGPHLHFEITYQMVPVDPQQLLPDPDGVPEGAE